MKVKFLFFLFLLQTITYSQENKQYKSLISLDEKRIIDYKNEVEQDSNVIFPKKMRLFFQGFKEDYAIFYDHNGHIAYYRYRTNKFDNSKKNIIEKLTTGIAYEIEGQFTGMIIFEQLNTTLYKSREDLDIINKKDINSIPVFRLQDCNQIILEQIIF